MGVAKKPQEVHMGVIFLHLQAKSNTFSRSRIFVGVAKKLMKNSWELQLSGMKYACDLQLYNSTVNDVQSFMFYFIGKYVESCFFPVFPDLPCAH
jgi:hypothetical protein